MDKKNRKEIVYTNSLLGRSKDDIIFDFAYSLATAPHQHPKNETKKALLKIWKNYDLTEELQEKDRRKYQGRALMRDESFVRLAVLLKEGTKDNDLMFGIAGRVLMDLSDCIESLLDGESNIRSIEELNNSMISKDNGHINWVKVKRDWSPAVAYLKTFCSKDILKEGMVKRGFSLNEDYEALADFVLNDDEMSWFADWAGEDADKKRISKYRNRSEFYDLCIELAYDRLSYLQSYFMFVSASPEFGSFRGHRIAGLEMDAEGMNEGYSNILQGEKEASFLAAEKPDIEMGPPSDESYFNYWTAKAALEAAYEYARSDIDILAITRSADLSRKDMTDIIKEAFLCYETTKGENIGFASKRDREAVVRLVVRFWMSESLAKELSRLLKDKKKPADEGTAKYKRLLDEQKKQNEKLKGEASRAEERIATAEKNADKRVKAIMGEMASLKKELKEKDELIAEKNKEIDEIKRLSEEFETDILDYADDKDRVTEEVFREYIQEHRVLVWGLREETEQKFRDMFPQLSFISSDRKLTKTQLDTYEVLIMATNFTSHGDFYNARDTAKRTGIKMAFLEKTANTPDSLYRALDIAVFRGAKALH